MTDLAQKALAQINAQCGGTAPNSIKLPNCTKSFGLDTVWTIVRITSEVAGAVCLLVIVISGFRYVISAGSPEKIKQSKDAIIYAAVGLVVSISAFMIVGFVVGKL